VGDRAGFEPAERFLGEPGLLGDLRERQPGGLAGLLQLGDAAAECEVERCRVGQLFGGEEFGNPRLVGPLRSRFRSTRPPLFVLAPLLRTEGRRAKSGVRLWSASWSVLAAWVLCGAGASVGNR